MKGEQRRNIEVANAMHTSAKKGLMHVSRVDEERLTRPAVSSIGPVSAIVHLYQFNGVAL